MSDDQSPAIPADAALARLIGAARAATPARVLAGRAGSSYRTTTQLELLEDHAAAVDAVHAEVDPRRDFGDVFVDRWDLFEVRTLARTKAEYLVRPDLGRRLDDAAIEAVRKAPRGVDLQVIVGDGLSAAAVIGQAPALLPLLAEAAKARGWSFGRPFFVRGCRVGVLNDVGMVLDPVVAVLLIGERPGLATSDSLSAYLAYRPRPGHTDAHRNLISNIHGRGTSPVDASRRIVALAARLMRLGRGGVEVKEAADELPGGSRS